MGKKVLSLALAVVMVIGLLPAIYAAGANTSINLVGKTTAYVGDTTKWTSNQWVWWTSGNPGVATVDQNGNIKAIKAGKADITATAADGRKKTVTFVVYNRPGAKIDIEFVGKTTAYVGQTTKWTSNQWVWWTSGNPGVATVDQNGNIKAIKAGKAHITATAADGRKKTVTFTVYNVPTHEQFVNMISQRNKTIYASDKKAPSYYLRKDIAIDPEIVKLSNEICKNASSDYDKVKKINTWVAENIYYNMGYYNDPDYYGTPVPSNVMVCGGYASLMKNLIRAQNIPCQEVWGYALGNGTARKWNLNNTVSGYGNHSWNRAYVNNRWINLDATWDSGNKYENGKYKKVTYSKKRHFDIADATLANTHRVEYIVDEYNWDFM